MILIADSGSTKTSWCFINNQKKATRLYTSGINPFFRASSDIESELRTKLMKKIPENVDNIFFYGAGIINEEKGEIVHRALAHLFPTAKVETFSDLLAAVHATLGNTKGIACILGTGSNSCFFDGNKITEHVPPLGFVLGDEGSGAVLGKKLIADYLKGIMPEKLSIQFKKRFPLSYGELMESVYKKEKPNLFLADFVPFIAENISEKYCNELVINSLEEFIKRNIFQYTYYSNCPISFVGSVAFYFRNQLETVFKKHNLLLNKVIKHPLNGLVEYYTQREI